MSTEAKEAPELRCISVTVAPYLAFPLAQHTYHGSFILHKPYFGYLPFFNYFCKMNCNYF